MKNIFKPTIKKRVSFFLINDIAISLFTFYFAYLLRFNFHIPNVWYENLLTLFLILVLFKTFFLYLFRVYNIPWRFFSLDSFKQIIKAHIVAYVAFIVVFWIFKSYLGPIPRSVLLIDIFLSIFFIGSLRVSKRVLLESVNKQGVPALIYGASSNGEMVVRYLMNENSLFYPVAFLDQDNQRIGSYIHNLKIYSVDEIQKLSKKYQVDALILSEKLTPKELDSIFEKARDAGISTFRQMQFFDKEHKDLKDISIEDLLARKPKDLDTKAIKEFIKDKTILITGAGGSIGSELCRLCAKYMAKELILVDNSEFNLYKISEELADKNIISKLISVLDLPKMEKLFIDKRPDVVIHAAAFKHVPLVEQNIESAIENNIKGTINMVDLSNKYKVKNFVFISTDKAVRPTSVMGATKRVCELYIRAVPKFDTKIAIVRFGNVLGSSGSVVPKFRAQIEAQKPLTVTHPEITRYFMLIREACELVLQATTLSKDRETFILDMGKPVKILDLAKKMIALSGRKDIGIKFIGLRAGEKLYEELLINKDDIKTKYSSIFIAKEEKVDFYQLMSKIEEIFKTSNKIEALKKAVPEFKHNTPNP